MTIADLRLQAGRCSACGTWLSADRGAIRGCCINVECRMRLHHQPLRRPRPDAGATVRAAANREGVA